MPKLHFSEHNVRHTSQITMITTPLMGLLFVDDTDLIALAEPGKPDMEVASRLQVSVNTWQTGLQVIGRAP